MPPLMPKVHEKDYIVTEQEAIHFMGPQVPAVLSTPALINWMELTSRENVLPLMGPGEDTVGVSVRVRHLAATPLGMKVRVISRLVKVEGRTYTFEVEAFDDFDKIGEAAHERASVLIDKFASRMAAKSGKSRSAG
jgi:fluoroacetyl-CoA thioesterase